MNRTSKILPVALAAALAAVPAFAQSPGGTPGTSSTPPSPAGSGGASPGAVVPEISRTAPGTTTQGAAKSTIVAPPSVLPADSVLVHRPRATQLVGTKVRNDSGETVGAIDDLILTGKTADTQAMTAVIQVGGFLGIGGHLVAVPLSDLHWNAESESAVLPNATKEALQARVAFSYDTLRRN